MTVLKTEIITDPAELARRCGELRRNGKTIGLVPTMGALHPGHLSLVLTSKSECDATVVSIFVNPTQFAPNEDFDKYPRTLSADVELLRQIDGVDFVFAPSSEAMYPTGFESTVHVGGLTRILEGEFRPTHFDGVTTVVQKLMNTAGADRAYFGQKDFQQAAVIRKMVRDLNMPVEVVVCPIIREPDGLAMSSRNRYLTKERRKEALVLYEALGEAEYRIHAGERNAETIRGEIRQMIERIPDTKIDYIALVDPDSLAEISNIAGNVAILLAVRFGEVRLIDNMIVQPQ